MSSTRRYDLSELVALTRWTWTRLQQSAKLSGREIMRYRRDGVSPIVASRLANICGLHPAEVWPSWFDDCVEDAGRPCDECGEKFLPARRDARFCQERCYRRWWGRETARRRRATPEGKAQNRARRRRYYAENGEYERRRERERYRRAKMGDDGRRGAGGLDRISPDAA